MIVYHSPIKILSRSTIFKGNSICNNNSPNNIDIKNFKVIDEYVSRGSQPSREQLKQLKKNNYSIIINFRTMFVSAIDYDEKEVVENMGMKYYNLPIISANGPSNKLIEEFFKIIEEAKLNKQKVFIHCKQGQDRTGFMSALYRLKYKQGQFQECIKEMIQMGHNQLRFPNMVSQLKEKAHILFPYSY